MAETQDQTLVDPSEDGGMVGVEGSAQEPEGGDDEKGPDTSWGGFFISLIACMLVPILALWNGPEYLLQKQYLKGTLLMTIVIVEVGLVWSVIAG